MVPKSTQLASCGPPGRFYCDFGAKSMGPLSPPPTSSGGTGSLFCAALTSTPTPMESLLRGHSAWGIRQEERMERGGLSVGLARGEEAGPIVAKEVDSGCPSVLPVPPFHHL